MEADGGDRIGQHDAGSETLNGGLFARPEDRTPARTKRPSRFWRRMGQVSAGLFVAALLLLGGTLAAVESGLFDRVLTERAQAALNDALGPRFTAHVGSTKIRFTADAKLALEARNVDTIDVASGQHMSQAASIRLAVDPKAFFSGNVVVNRIEADGVELDATLLPSGEPLDLAALRVDQMPAVLESLMLQLDTLSGVVARAHTDRVSISSITVVLPSGHHEPLTIALEDLGLTAGDSGLLLDGKLTIDGVTSSITAELPLDGARTKGLSATISDVPLTRFLLARSATDEPRVGIDGRAKLEIAALRASETSPGALSAKVDIGNAILYSDGIEQSLDEATLRAIYDFDKNSIEFLPSRLRFGATTIPFTAGLIDLDRLDAKAPRGFGIDLLVSNGVAAPGGTGGGPMAYSATVTGRYVTDIREFQFERMAVSSPVGMLAGSMVVRLKDEGSPEISFGAQSSSLQTEAVKQMWPYWMAAKARAWALANIYGGTLTDASISVFIPGGRIPHGGGPLHLTRDELNIGFNMSDARVNVTGDIPPLRDVTGRFELLGPEVSVRVRQATSYFPSGKSVSLGEGSSFVIADSYEKPLMAEIDLAVRGKADAIGELLTFKPVAVLQRTGFRPEDFAGDVSASVQAKFGLVTAQEPPPPVWKAALSLDGVDLKKPLEGQSITALEGTLDIDPVRAVLTADGRIGPIPASFSLTEPVSKESKAERKQTITATIDGDQIGKLAPGIGNILKGSAKVEATLLPNGRRAVKADLSRAVVSVPWIGWTKGNGIPASAAFEVGSKDGQTVLDDFTIGGDGFGVSGKLEFSKGAFVSAAFDRVRLAAEDDYALTVKRARDGYSVRVSGKSADIRPVIDRLRSSASGGGKGGDSGNTSIQADLDSIVGYNNERIDDVKLEYTTRGSKIGDVDFSGVTDSGQAVVSQLSRNGDSNVIRLTSGDAGSVARFLDLYKRMRGGLLNLQMRSSPDGGAWSGNVDIRNFTLANEQKLQSIVSTPVGNDGRSLNRAVRKDIDVSSESFSRAFARLILRDGAIQIENGILRGSQVGATFQGVLRDQRGAMDMTGTFMPAYGLNRLFAELPIVGVLLGNGRDRGLLGITFRLQGKFEEPKLIINPLSIIAPGVFRQIFEFQ